MEAIRSAASALCGLALLSCAFDALLPEGAVRRGFAFVFSLAVLLALLTPVRALAVFLRGFGS